MHVRGRDAQVNLDTAGEETRRSTKIITGQPLWDLPQALDLIRKPGSPLRIFVE
jgi:hypothetical protein